MNDAFAEARSRLASPSISTNPDDDDCCVVQPKPAKRQIERTISNESSAEEDVGINSESQLLVAVFFFVSLCRGFLLREDVGQSFRIPIRISMCARATVEDGTWTLLSRIVYLR